MALNAYLRVTGATQGKIAGSATQAGRGGSLVVIGAHHTVSPPVDPSTGMPSGRRRHTPYVITKEVEVASVCLYAALVNNERLSEWELQYWQPSATGAERRHYTVQLYDARVVGIEHEMPNNRVPATAHLTEREHVSFSYSRIVWTWVAGGITAEDDWETPTV